MIYFYTDYNTLVQEITMVGKYTQAIAWVEKEGDLLWNVTIAVFDAYVLAFVESVRLLVKALCPGCFFFQTKKKDYLRECNQLLLCTI